MSSEPIKASKHVLEPNERISEVLFGLIMVLTFTGSLTGAISRRTPPGVGGGICLSEPQDTSFSPTGLG